MRARKPLPKGPSGYAKLNPVNREAIYHNLDREGKTWIGRQAEFLGKRGNRLVGKQTIKTPLVKQKAHELSHGKEALAAARSILNYSSNIPFVETSDVIAARFYGKQSADDIVSGRKIPTFSGARYGLLGCQTFCATLVSLLKAARPAEGRITHVKAVRTLAPHTHGKDGRILGMPHTIVTFRVNGKGYVADPFKKGHTFLGSNMIGQKDRMLVEEEKIADKIAALKRQGSWKEANDTADFGINSFEKYVEEARAHGRELATMTDFERFLEEMRKKKE